MSCLLGDLSLIQLSFSSYGWALRRPFFPELTRRLEEQLTTLRSRVNDKLGQARLGRDLGGAWALARADLQEDTPVRVQPVVGTGDGPAHHGQPLVAAVERPHRLAADMVAWQAGELTGRNIGQGAGDDVNVAAQRARQRLVQVTTAHGQAFSTRTVELSPMDRIGIDLGGPDPRPRRPLGDGKRYRPRSGSEVDSDPLAGGIEQLRRAPHEISTPGSRDENAPAHADPDTRQGSRPQDVLRRLARLAPTDVVLHRRPTPGGGG